MLGVLGGMGPLATADFLGKLVSRTRAAADQEHIPMVVWSVPQVPDRTRAILAGGESPVAAMAHGLRQLRRMGATVAAIPCNTAHYWHDELVARSGLDVLHIVDAVRDRLREDTPMARRVGLLSTEGTIRSGIYEDRLGRDEYSLLLPDEAARRAVSQGIHLVKQGSISAARTIFSIEIDRLLQRGAEVVVLGCTEIPVAAPTTPRVIDATDALARRCVRWFDQTFRGIPMTTPVPWQATTTARIEAGLNSVGSA